ncbi:MAG: 50S ribosomal protein L28 [Deltaproteobacteria bacterium]|nr:50S ribosomal protein L28 [Deltaproteobacteria bacterium]MBI4224532.1 50S ribosomal protein L28 [Deltaproteobacteria bacterium]
MARQCKICGKQAVTGNKISHSNIKTKTRNHPNLQKVCAFFEGQVRHILVCTRCIRSGLVQKTA